jgi:hypothetical protein
LGPRAKEEDARRRSEIMQADCFADYIRCVRENTTGALAADLVCTATLINCMNAHLYSTLGEHLVERPGEANVTGKAFLEAGLVVKVLERHEGEVQTFANCVRSLGSVAPAMDQSPLKNLERDLDEFVQTIIQDLQHRHQSD